MHISVIIVSKGRREYTTKLLYQLSLQNIQIDKLIFIENILAEKFFSKKSIIDIINNPQCEVIYETTKSNTISGSRNQGFRHIGEGYVFCIDNDVEIGKDLLKNAILSYEQHSKENDILGLWVNIKPKFSNYWSKFSCNYTLGQMTNISTQSAKTEFAPFLFILIKYTNKLKKTRFDESFFTSEDIDFCLRYADFKPKYLYVNHLHVYHVFPTTLLGTFLKQLQYAYSYPRRRIKNYSSVDEIYNYIPSRKLHLLMYPVFILVGMISKLAIVKKSVKPSNFYLFGSIIEELAIILALNFTKDGHEVLSQSIKRIMSN